MITPIQGRVLVRLKSQYQHLRDTSDEQFGNSKTRGEVLALAEDVKIICKRKGVEVGKTVYFGKYEDTAPYGNDQDLILIKLEDVGGVSDGEDD